MQIQKNLFKLSEKILLNSSTKTFCKSVCFLSFFLVLLAGTVFTVGVSHYSKGSSILQRCFTVNNPIVSQLTQKDVIIYIEFQKNVNPLFNPPQNFLFLNNTQNHCKIYKNMEKNHESVLSYTRTPNLPTVNKQTLNQKGFNNYTVYISESILTTFEKVFLGGPELIINQLLESNTFNYSSFYQITYQQQNMYFSKFINNNKIIILIKSIIGIFALSIVSLLYIYATVISAPAFIINIIDLFKIHNAIHRVTIYKVFPWIGIFMHPLDQHQNDRKSSKYISNASVISFCLIYFIYFGVMIGVGNFLFVKPILGANNQNFFGIIAAAEFCSIVFVRTRTSIKYFPTVFILLQLMFSYYCCIANFGYKNWLLVFSGCGSLMTLSLLILFLQIPSLQTWDKQSHLTPSQQRPRTLYLSHYNLMWNNDIPDLQMIGVPAFNRSQFLPEELVLVDENFNLLSEMLTVAEQQ